MLASYVLLLADISYVLLLDTVYIQWLAPYAMTYVLFLWCTNGWPFTWWYYHTALNALLWCAVVKSEGCYTSCLAWLQALHLIGQLIANKRKQEIQLFLQPSALITFLWRHATWCSVTILLCNSSKVQTKSLVWKRKTLARAVWRITMNNYSHLWRMSGKFHHGL